MEFVRYIIMTIVMPVAKIIVNGKKDVYEYPFENGVRLYMDDFYMARELDFIIPYYLQTK